jgi:phage terminase large subunit GpA-like protein
VVIGFPDRSLAGKYWRSKFKPVLERSALLHLMPPEGPGSDGGAPEDVLFTTGARLFMLGAGARNEAGQSMITAPIVKVEERDSIRSRWVELLFQRAESYGDAKRLDSTSTIKQDKGSTTLAVYEASLALRPYFQCPMCVADQHPSGGWQTLEPDRLRYTATDDITAAETAHLECAHVPAHQITETIRRRMIGPGPSKWRPRGARSERAGRRHRDRRAAAHAGVGLPLDRARLAAEDPAPALPFVTARPAIGATPMATTSRCASCTATSG